MPKKQQKKQLFKILVRPELPEKTFLCHKKIPPPPDGNSFFVREKQLFPIM